MTDPAPEIETRRPGEAAMVADVWRWVASITGETPDPGVTLLDAVKTAAARYVTIPQVGEYVSGARVRDCAVGTVLGARHAAMAAVRHVNGWSTTVRGREDDDNLLRINEWRVLYVPEKT